MNMPQKLKFREFIGWMAAILFGLCALPQVLLCIEQGHAQGLSSLTLNMWFFGELCGLYYVWPDKKWPLTVNYTFNILLLLIIIYYKIIGG